MRRWFIFHPLAVALAILMALPVLSWQQGSNEGRVHLFQASAEATLVCPPNPANLIIQNTCPAGAQAPFLARDLKQLDSDAVNAYLALHGLPASDAGVIYAYGRQDLHDAIRASIFNQMLAIIRKAPSDRTPHEQALFDWLQRLVQQNEIALYTTAIAEANRFINDPCTFKLDSDIASTYNLSYNGTPFCGGLQSNIFTPPVPAASYFTAYGFKKSYGAAAEQFAEFGSLMSDSSLSVGAQAGIALGAGAAVAAAVGIPLYISFSAALAAYTGGGTALAASSSFIVSGGAVSALGGAGIAVAAPVAIILISVAVGVIAALQLVTNSQRQSDIANFSNLLAQAQNNLPDLAAMVADTSGLGNYKIQATLYSQTVPDKPSSAMLPAHRPGTDFTFAITGASGSSSISDSLAYQDWGGNQAAVQTWGGWFLETCTTVNQPCLVSNGINADIRYVDGDGVNWTASRVGNSFVHTKAQPASTDLVCPADTKTGVTPAATDLTKCGTYTDDHITLKDGDGNLITAKLSVLTPPTLSGSTLLAFGPSIPATQTVTVMGNPAPSVCLSSGSLPADFSLNGGRCGTGTFQIQFNGNRDAPTARYALTLSASNSVGSISIPVTVDVSPQLAIISPHVLNVTAGVPVNFTVVATGVPTPRLSASENLLGLNFKDNGDGTATISGVVPFPESNAVCIEPCNTGISAINSQGTATQFLAITAGSPPLANLVPPTSATFSAGVPNVVRLKSYGAITPVSWTLIPDPNASWLNLKDNGDGTALLSGIPPRGTAGTFNPKIGPVAAGSFTVINPFPVTVVNRPVFTSPNSATFTVGKESGFGIAVSEGDITRVGALPAGLTFNASVSGPLGGGAAVISGTPAAGTGGQYIIELVATAPATQGPATQELTLNVNEAPIFTGPCPLPGRTPPACTVEVVPGGAFTVTTEGFPFMSLGPLPASAGPLPQLGTMSFFLLHLPAGFQATNRNAQDFATGTLTITAPTDAHVGDEWAVAIFADNGVPPQAEQDLFIKIVKAPTF
ncbi:MAG: hypothetical protein JO270_05140 [Acidobacteriaceae bacterium]|nr:hypothetical protein [Acidobacteriaceae bacterium]